MIETETNGFGNHCCLSWAVFQYKSQGIRRNTKWTCLARTIHVYCSYLHFVQASPKCRSSSLIIHIHNLNIFCLFFMYINLPVPWVPWFFGAHLGPARLDTAAIRQPFDDFWSKEKLPGECDRRIRPDMWKSNGTSFSQKSTATTNDTLC